VGDMTDTVGVGMGIEPRIQHSESCILNS